MDIRLKEPLYVSQNGQEYVIRQGTIGVEKSRIVHFHDVTGTVSVGFSRDFCLENPQIFQIAKTLSDREIPLRDVLEALSKLNINPEIKETLKQVFSSL